MSTLDANPSPTPRSTLSEVGGELDGAANILEQLLLDNGRPIDRGQIRRVMREAADAFPGTAPQLWWRWVGEGATNLGLKCKVVDCTPAEFRDLAADGARMVMYVDGPEPWRAVTDARGNKFRLARAFTGSTSRWGNSRDLDRLAGDPKNDATLRVVIVELSVALGEASGDESGTMPPLRRLLALLRPETSDIFILFIFALVAGLLTLATPIAVESLVNTVAFGRLGQPVVILTLLLFGFLSFSAAIRLLQTYVAEIIQCRLFARVSADLAYRIPRVQMEHVDGQHLPELVNRFFDVVSVQKVSAMLLLDGLSVVLSTFVGMAVLAFYHPWLLGFDVVLLALLAFTVFVLGRGAVATSIRESKFKYETAAWLEDVARCPVTFKFDGGAEFALERADLLTHEYLMARKRHFRVLMRQIALALCLHALASATLLGLGGWLVIDGQLTLGQLVAAELIVTMIVGAVAKMGKHMESFYDLLAAVDKLGEVVDLPIEEQEGVLHRFSGHPLSLTVHSVDYAFRSGPDVLQSVTLHVQAGECVALLGTGKSVLLDLVFGLRSPTHGHLSIDGLDPRDLRPDILRRYVSLARGVEVFHGSIAENVHLARPEITANAVRDALEQVGLLDSVLRFAEGIETELTSSGAPLTDNQLRRLVLARAIVGRPGLLLLDGLLDTLPDSEAEELMRMICDRRQPWTLVIATGRGTLRDFCSRSWYLGPQAGGEPATPGGPILEELDG